jgi:hypothetical protein
MKKGSSFPPPFPFPFPHFLPLLSMRGIRVALMPTATLRISYNDRSRQNRPSSPNSLSTIHEPHPSMPERSTDADSDPPQIIWEHSRRWTHFLPFPLPLPFPSPFLTHSQRLPFPLPLPLPFPFPHTLAETSTFVGTSMKRRKTLLLNSLCLGGPTLVWGGTGQ